jgi:3-dehydroquinate dehydratase
MPESAKSTLSNVVGVLQLIALVIGVAGLFTLVGKRDQQLTQVGADLDKLAEVVNDLAKSHASVAVNDAMQAAALQDIQRRLNEIERSMK